MAPKLLVVDDDENIRNLLEAMLGALGCEVITAENGTHALELVELNQFDMILLDLMMPGLSGIGVLKMLKDNPDTSEIPVVLVTAIDGSDEIMSGYQHGATYYITKPFNPDQIVYAIDLALAPAEEKEESDENVYELDLNW